MKVLYVGLRDPRHSSAGGYDWITRYPGSKTLWDYQALFSFLKPNQRGKRINLFFQDLKARRMAKEYDIVHYFYGDNLKREFPPNRDYKVVATIHMDITKKKEMEGFVRILNSLDGVVTLSTSQKKTLEQLGVSSVFIPHGFNDPVFTTVDMGIDKRMINIVVSGSNYRDIETLHYAIDYCEKNRNDIRFHLLGQPSSIKDGLANKINAICYPRLDDDHYYSLMAACDFSFLPLTFATANNALLEAQFLGIKGILPQIEGISDYAAPAPLNYFYSSKKDLDSFFYSVEKNNVSEDLKDFSARFKWDAVYKQLLEYYNTLMNHNSLL